MAYLELKQIILEGKGKIEIFHFQPESADDERRGNLFFIGQISHTFHPRDSFYYLLNSLAASLKREYYSPALAQHNQAFEAALKRVNDILLTLPEQARKAIELAILVFRKNQVSFSVVGGTEILLIRGEGLFKLHHQSPNEKGLFKNIIKGKIRNHDRVIIATNKIAPLLNEKTFNSRLIKRSFDRLEDYLKKEDALLKEDRRGLALLHISIGTITPDASKIDQSSNFEKSLTKKEVGQDTHIKKQGVSLQGILPFEKKANWKSKSFSIFQNKVIPDLLSIKNYIIKRMHAVVQKRTFLIPRINEFVFRRLKINEFVFRRLKINEFVFRRLKINFLFPSLSYKKRRLSFPSSPTLKTSKIIAFSLGAIVIVFLGIFLFEKKHTDSLLVEKKNESATSENLEGMIVSYKDVKEVFSTGFLTPTKAFLFTPVSILESDLLTKNIDPIANINQPISYTLKNDTPLFLIKEDKKLYLAAYQEQQKTITKEILSWPLNEVAVSDMAFYSGNVYILDNHSKQILKYQKNNFLNPIFWLNGKKTKPDLKNPVSIASDGSMYVLDLPNRIIEFRLGKKVREIAITQLISPQSKLKIVGADYLAIVDPTNKTLIVLNKKQGKTLHVDSLSSLGDVLDILPQEKSQELMTLTKQGVFKRPYSIP